MVLNKIPMLQIVTTTTRTTTIVHDISHQHYIVSEIEHKQKEQSRDVWTLVRGLGL